MPSEGAPSRICRPKVHRPDALGPCQSGVPVDAEKKHGSVSVPEFQLRPRKCTKTSSTLQKIPQVLALAVRVVAVLSLVESADPPLILRRVAVPEFPIRQKRGPKTMG
uniref:Uncharacterized protein n=1 Tax=Globodera rostochiensis TaxID=31243 RepID=A0A914H9F9_GLORO